MTFGLSCGFCQKESHHGVATFDGEEGESDESVYRRAQNAGWRYGLEYQSAEYFVTCPRCVVSAMEVVNIAPKVKP